MSTLRSLLTSIAVIKQPFSMELLSCTKHNIQLFICFACVALFSLQNVTHEFCQNVRVYFLLDALNITLIVLCNQFFAHYLVIDFYESRPTEMEIMSEFVKVKTLFCKGCL